MNTPWSIAFIIAITLISSRIGYCLAMENAREVIYLTEKAYAKRIREVISEKDEKEVGEE